MKKKLLQIFKETEMATAYKNEKICMKILKELANYTHCSFLLSNLDNTNASSRISSILLNPELKYIQWELLSLLEKYHVNTRSLLLRLTIPFCHPDLSQENIEKYIDSFCQLPYHWHFDGNSKHCTIKTQFGTLEMFKLSDFTENKNLKYELEHIRFQGYCHESVEYFRDAFAHDWITTSEMSDLFTGYYYHSYYILNGNEGVVDVSRNIFYPNTCFQKIFLPNVILSYPANEFEKYFIEFQKQEEIEAMYPVIQLALHQKRKK